MGVIKTKTNNTGEFLLNFDEGFGKRSFDKV